jgi:hypothetical protein
LGQKGKKKERVGERNGGREGGKGEVKEIKRILRESYYLKNKKKAIKNKNIFSNLFLTVIPAQPFISKN